MKAIVFGGTGFIGSHVVEQLHLAGHQVTVAIRDTSNSSFLETLGVNIVRIDFSIEAIGKIMQGHEVVYNCTADANVHTLNTMNAPVEILLTKKLIEAASLNGVTRFIQLSSIVIYDFKNNNPIDESYISQPDSLMQKVFLEREKVIEEAGRNYGIETVIIRPASTIGVRDVKSFFSRLFTSYMNNQFPMVENGDREVSLIDTRDIGRAMEWLGTYKKSINDTGIFLIKGFDTTWNSLKKEMDRVIGKNAKILQLPSTDQSFMVKNFTVNRIWNDDKIKGLGFSTKYSLTDAVESSVYDLQYRNKYV